VFRVEISRDSPVSFLQELIKNKKPHAFQHVDPDDLELWEVSQRV
jgi:hypothetical protein